MRRGKVQREPVQTRKRFLCEQIEGTEAKQLMMTFAYRSPFYLFYDFDNVYLKNTVIMNARCTN